MTAATNIRQIRARSLLTGHHLWVSTVSHEWAGPAITDVYYDDATDRIIVRTFNGGERTFRPADAVMVCDHDDLRGDTV